jgi:hypothetical protein
VNTVTSVPDPLAKSQHVTGYEVAHKLLRLPELLGGPDVELVIVGWSNAKSLLMVYTQALNTCDRPWLAPQWLPVNFSSRMKYNTSVCLREWVYWSG